MAERTGSVQMASAFTHMADALGTPRLRKRPGRSSTRPGSHAHTMLEILTKASGDKVSSQALANAAGVETNQVLGILKHSISVGRVAYQLDEAKRLGWYSLRLDFEEEIHAQLLEAASFLRRHGWKVTRP